MVLHRNNQKDTSTLATDEAIFATQNNYLGVRGNFEEGVPYQSSLRGTYINGFYDRHTITYGESAYGYPQEGQTIVNLPDAQTIILKIDGIPVDLNYAKLLKLERNYDLKNGFTTRSALYETMEGMQLWIHSKRLTHLTFKPLFLIDYTIESVNFEGKIHIESTLDGDIDNLITANDMRAGSQLSKRIHTLEIHTHEDRAEMVIETLATRFKCTIGITHSTSFHYTQLDNLIIASKDIDINPNESFRFQKYALYYNELDHMDIPIHLSSGYRFVESTHINDLYKMQKDALKPYWDLSEIKIDTKNSASINQAIAFNLYQLYTSGAHSPRTNIPAKGLTGEGYEGHTFWDSEIYMLPYFMQINPDLALNLVEYRYYQLEAARKEAQNLGNPEGVKFAWRTISGEETSAYYPASTAQYHINSDVAYAVIQYYKLFKDERYMIHKGFPILLETARFFKDLVNKYQGKYHLHHVTGPDEYNAVVDDNYYTNAMLKYHLEFLLEYTKTRDDWINEEERLIFQDIANHIHLPFDASLNIDVQDASFLWKKPVDLNTIDSKKRPLLLHYHPLTIYRYQVIKQADTILAHTLLQNRPKDVMKASFDFYESRTTHDSSLSYSIHATQAAKLGDIEKAYQYFMKTVDLDLSDSHKNTFHGLHMANSGGIYYALLYGFMGYRIDSLIHISPRLPNAWNSLEMTFRINRNITVKAIVNHKTVKLRAIDNCQIVIFGELINLEKNTLTEVQLIQ